VKIASCLSSVIVSLCLAASCCADDPKPLYAVAVVNTPVLNTPDFAGVFGGGDGNTLRADSCGHIRALEFIALPGTRFRIEETRGKGSNTVYRVATEDYPYPAPNGYYVDSRFVQTGKEQPPTRALKLPPRTKVIANLLAAQGRDYVWGGNVSSGIPQMLRLFPPRQPLSPEAAGRWQMRGVDCSGLLYEATGGVTPRNTSALVGYGKAVPVAGLNAAAIVGRLEPLDLIVWNGHVLIVLDRLRLIESRPDCTGKPAGVRVRPLRAALDEIMKGRTPMNSFGEPAAAGVKGFVVRRWYEADL